METNYNFSKEDFDGSAALFAKYQAAKAINNDDENRVTGEKIWELTQQMEKLRVLGECTPAMKIQTLRDGLRGKLQYLETQRVKKIEDATLALEKYNKVFKQTLTRRIEAFYTKLEKQMTFEIVDAEGINLLNGRIVKFKSNIIPIFECMALVSATHERFNSLRAPLAELAEIVDDLEIKIPKTFSMTKFILTELEFLEFKSFLKPQTELEKFEYRPIILSTSQLKAKIEYWGKLAKR
jgi:hypothetical protein